MIVTEQYGIVNIPLFLPELLNIIPISVEEDQSSFNRVIIRHLLDWYFLNVTNDDLFKQLTDLGVCESVSNHLILHFEDMLATARGYRARVESLSFSIFNDLILNIRLRIYMANEEQEVIVDLYNLLEKNNITIPDYLKEKLISIGFDIQE